MRKRNKIRTERFLKGQANAYEAKQVIHELNRETREDGLDAEWEKAGEIPFTCQTEEVLNTLSSQITVTRTAGKPVDFSSIKYAAIILIVLGTGIGWWLRQLPDNNKEALHAMSACMLENTGNSILHFTLEDSSAVTLFPNATLRYNRDSMATGRGRDLYLKGHAYFNVYKHAGRPFTVRTSTLYTTALGTSFDVIETKEGCRVKLYSGSVLVGHDLPNGKWQKPVYLLPGEEINLQHQKTSFSTKDKKVTLSLPEAHPEKKTVNLLRFENTSLQDVFEILERRYHHAIRADSSISRHRFFTGELLPGDSLPVVLKVICSMNGLTMQDSSGVWLVKP